MGDADFNIVLYPEIGLSAAEWLKRTFGQPFVKTVPIGVAVLVCTVLYVIPRTSVFGAVLLTGFLGGAVATNVRVQSPLFSNELFPVYVAAFVWGGLLLRDPKLRDIFPIRR